MRNWSFDGLDGHHVEILSEQSSLHQYWRDVRLEHGMEGRR
jgi:hypothetical protein